MKWVAIYPKVTMPRVTRYLKATLVQYSKFIVDEKNVKGVANTYYYIYSCNIDQKNSFEFCNSPFTPKSDQIYGFDSKLTDTTVGLSLIQPTLPLIDEVSYHASGINLNVGNLVHFQISQEAYLIAPVSDPSRSKRYGIFNSVLVFGVNTTVEIKKLIFNKAVIHDVVFNSTDYENVTNATYKRFALLTFPNYHSYLIRYRTFVKNETTFFKMYNIFAELENTFHDNRPVCHKWACCQVSKFENRYFIRVYDMMPERMYTANYSASNFEDVFGKDDHASGLFVNKEDSFPFFLLEKIPDKYTMYPIEVYNITDMQLMEFDTLYNNSKRPDQLRLIVVSNPNKITALNINRRLRVTTNNLYFTSKYAEVSIRKAYSIMSKLRFDFKNYKEPDFYKYFIHLAIILVVSVVFLFIYFKRLNEMVEEEERKAEDAIQRSYINRTGEEVTEPLKETELAQEPTSPLQNWKAKFEDEEEDHF